jgi:hypothetical protein
LSEWLTAATAPLREGPLTHEIVLIAQQLQLPQRDWLGFCLFSSWNDFDLVFAFLFYAAAATVNRLLLCNGSYTSPLTHR